MACTNIWANVKASANTIDTEPVTPAKTKTEITDGDVTPTQEKYDASIVNANWLSNNPASTDTPIEWPTGITAILD